MGIRVITQPGVFVLGRPSLDRDELARYLEAVGAPGWTTDAPTDAEALVETASRGCYSSYLSPRPGGNAAHLGHVIESGHLSVLEHAQWTVALTGISRSLSHELVRHRHMSPSQLSQRFYDESEAAFVLPPLLAELDSPAARRQWQEACADALHQYRTLCTSLSDDHRVRAIPDATLRRKRIREAARSVLPNCVETRIVLSGNARAFRWLCEIRGDVAADLEFRRLAVVLARRLKAEAPNLFADVTLFTDSDGRESVWVGRGG